MKVFEGDLQASKFIKNWVIAAAVGCSVFILTPDGPRNFLGKPATEVYLGQTKNLIERFEKAYKRVPRSLSELRCFGYMMGRTYTPYDGFGTRVFYKALSDDYYVVQSLGNPSFRGLSSVRLPPFSQPVLGQNEIRPVLRSYPAILLEGARYHSGSYLARVVRDPRFGKKTLLVHRIDDPGRFWLSPHPNVEEFFWLSSSKLIYTAAGDLGYEDGIFLWDLKDQSTINLLKSSRLGAAWFGSAEPRYLLSLASVFNNTVYAYVAKHKDARLSLSEFLSSEYLYELRFDQNWEFQAVLRFKGVTGSALVEFARNHPGVMEPGLRNIIQTDWAALPFYGEPGQVIDTWQAFALRYSKSPLFPYSLLWLKSLYRDAALVLKMAEPETAKKLDELGSEVAIASSGLGASPAYIQMLADDSRHIFQNKHRPQLMLTDFKER